MKNNMTEDNRKLQVAHNTMESKDLKSMINNKVPNLSTNKKFYYKNKITKYMQLRKKPIFNSDKKKPKFAPNLSSFGGASPNKKVFQKSKLMQKATIEDEVEDVPKSKIKDSRKSSNFGSSSEYMIRPKMSIKSRLLGCNSANKLRQSNNSESNLKNISNLKGNKFS